MEENTTTMKTSKPVSTQSNTRISKEIPGGPGKGQPNKKLRKEDLKEVNKTTVEKEWTCSVKHSGFNTHIYLFTSTN